MRRLDHWLARLESAAVALNLFLGSLRFERPVLHLYRASWPVVFFLALGLITSLPELSLGLGRLLGYDHLPMRHW